MPRADRLLLLQLFGLAALTGCGRASDTQLTSSADAPSARGEVCFERGKNGNTQLQVKVRRLAPASQVESGMSTYVVWAKPNSSAEPQNIGALRVGDERTGELATKTPLHDFDLIITPERQAMATRPTGVCVLSARIESR